MANNDRIVELVSDFFITHAVMSAEDWDNILLEASE